MGSILIPAVARRHRRHQATAAARRGSIGGSGGSADGWDGLGGPPAGGRDRWVRVVGRDPGVEAGPAVRGHTRRVVAIRYPRWRQFRARTRRRHGPQRPGSRAAGRLLPVGHRNHESCGAREQQCGDDETAGKRLGGAAEGDSRGEAAAANLRAPLRSETGDEVRPRRPEQQGQNRPDDSARPIVAPDRRAEHQREDRGDAENGHGDRRDRPGCLQPLPRALLGRNRRHRLSGRHGCDAGGVTAAHRPCGRAAPPLRSSLRWAWLRRGFRCGRDSRRGGRMRGRRCRGERRGRHGSSPIRRRVGRTCVPGEGRRRSAGHVAWRSC